MKYERSMNEVIVVGVNERLKQTIQTESTFIESSQMKASGFIHSSSKCRY